tara:strand:- start:87 stop:467 length:381 start_codon:yes stop_codon:yes gene_type:complete
MDTLLINDVKVAELVAQRVVEARSALAEAKEVADEAERHFKALEVDSVTLEDGTKVAVVSQNRRTIDNKALESVLPKGQHQRVTKRVGDLKMIDGGIEAGWLDSDIVGQAINTKSVLAVKVTQPKR